MENKDEYTVKICINKEFYRTDYYFYKNGLLHREAGPAILLGLNKVEFDKLEDNHLYKEELIFKRVPPGYECKYVRATPPAIAVVKHYLNGIAYQTEKEFNIAKFNKELEQELPVTKLTNKKPKI